MSEKVLVDRELLNDLVSSLEGEVESRYSNGIKDHPAMRRDYECDIEPVIRGKELLAAPAAPVVQHSDDAAVDRFAAAMKEKLAAARAKGRAGWDDPNACPVETLATLLISHLRKGNAGTFEDVANFAMMLHQRGADPRVLADAAPVVQAEQEPVAWALPDPNPSAQRPFLVLFHSPSQVTDPEQLVPLYAAPSAHPDAVLVEALEKILADDYEAPHDATDFDVMMSRGMMIRRMQKEATKALAVYRAALAGKGATK